MTEHKTAELVSLFLTTPTIILAAGVVFIWWRAANLAIKNKERKPMHWFIMGVFFGFIGQFLDNIYWGIAWALSFLDSDLKTAYFENGVYFNIFSRQICGTVAALFHLMAAVKTESHKLKLVYFFSAIIIISSISAYAILSV